jgi:hypothetical protein
MAKKRAFPLGTVIYRIDKELSKLAKGAPYYEHEREERLLAFLKEHPSYKPTDMMLVRQMLKLHRKRTSPRADSPGGIFHPARPLYLGKGLVALSGPAIVPVLDLFIAKKKEAIRSATEAHERFLGKIMPRRELMLRHDQPWEQIEINFFGWDASKSHTLPPEIIDDGSDGDEDDEE